MTRKKGPYTKEDLLDMAMDLRSRGLTFKFVIDDNGDPSFLISPMKCPECLRLAGIEREQGELCEIHNPFINEDA